MLRVAPKEPGSRPIYPRLSNSFLTIVISDHAAPGVPAWEFHSTEPDAWGRDLDVMAKSDESQELSWPWWAPWALLAVAATSLLTIGATLYDIL